MAEEIKASMAGNVWKIQVKEGDTVRMLELEFEFMY